MLKTTWIFSETLKTGTILRTCNKIEINNSYEISENRPTVVETTAQHLSDP
jgi:hypothetical protein